MFRRRTEASDQAPSEEPKPEGKGRPTPKRKDAEGRRRRPVSAPRDRKQAYRQVRERQRADRERARAGMRRGEEKYLPPRDKGPVRKFARDWVDSRRIPSQYFLPFSLVLLAVAYLPAGNARPYLYAAMITVMWPVMLVALIGGSWWVARTIKKAATEKFPDEDLKGVGFYAAMRALQMRRLRFPAPTVAPGGKPVTPKR